MLASDTVSASTRTILPQGSVEGVHPLACSALGLTFCTSLFWVVCQQDLGEPFFIFLLIFGGGLFVLFCFKKIILRYRDSRYFSSKPFQPTGLYLNFRKSQQILTFRRWANRKSQPPRRAADGYREAERGQNMTRWPFSALSVLILYSLCAVLPLSMNWPKKSSRSEELPNQYI